MDTICEFLRHDHKRCDDLLRQAETSIAQRNWEDARRCFRLYDDMLRQHIRMEEKVLMPAFLQAIAESAAPISMLRMEHQQIHGIVSRMWNAIRNADPTDYVLHAETLTLLMQQHVMKEEDMLYPLLDKALARKRDSIINAMAEYLGSASPDLATG